jgi:hypothetical protein
MRARRLVSPVLVAVVTLSAPLALGGPVPEGIAVTPCTTPLTPLEPTAPRPPR